ncbi:MAG: hypothetical protein ACXU8N_18400 [Telluria sp.]
MPKYRVKEKSLIGNTLHEAGDIVEYDGLPAENLEPMCEEGEAKYQEYLASNRERVAKLNEQYSESAVGDPTQFAAKFAAELQRSNEEFKASIPGMIAAAVAQAMAIAFPNGIAAAAAPVTETTIAAAPAPAAGEAPAAKPAAKGKADKPTTDGEGLV